jgi:preprotein translocase subunit SecG
MDPEEVRAQLKKWAIIGSFFALALLLYVSGQRALLIAYVVIVGVLAVLAILIQSGRGGGLAASLGGVGADSLLGTHSASPIARATYVMLGLFFFISILAARMGVRQRAEDAFMPGEPPPATVPAPGSAADMPVVPAAPAPEGAPAEPAGVPVADEQPAAQPEELPADD